MYIFAIDKLTQSSLQIKSNTTMVTTTYLTYLLPCLPFQSSCKSHFVQNNIKKFLKVLLVAKSYAHWKITSHWTHLGFITTKLSLDKAENLLYTTIYCTNLNLPINGSNHLFCWRKSTRNHLWPTKKMC